MVDYIGWGIRRPEEFTADALYRDFVRHDREARHCARELGYLVAYGNVDLRLVANLESAYAQHRKAMSLFVPWCAKQLLLPSDATMPIPGPETGPGAPQPPNPAPLDPHTSDRPSAGPSWDRPEVVTVIDREGRLWVRFEEQDCWVDLLENYCTAAEIEEMYAPCTVHSILADDDGARA